MSRIAAVTMAYDEPDFLPIWVGHYAAQVGAAHCYVVDHGSDDGSTRALGGVNVVRIPRSALDDARRCRFISGFVSSLLEWYDWVIHADTDEIVVPDPARHASLAAYAAACREPVASAIGFNLVQTPWEAAIDPGRPILRQRGWVHFLASMCKPVLTREPIRWEPGFHRAGAPPRFDDLYLFHLRWFDRDIAARRLRRSRNQPWANEQTGWWQRLSDQDGAAMFDALGRRPQAADVRLEGACPEVRQALLRSFSAADAGEGGEEYDMNYQVVELWPVPDRFADLF